MDKIGNMLIDLSSDSYFWQLLQHWNRTVPRVRMKHRKKHKLLRGTLTYLREEITHRMFISNDDRLPILFNLLSDRRNIRIRG